jgi:hypothetical protein
LKIVAVGTTRRYDLFGPEVYRNLSRVVAPGDVASFAAAFAQDELCVMPTHELSSSLRVHRQHRF